MAELDQTLIAGIKGYAFLPDLRRRHHDRPVHLRVLGQRAVAVCGPDAVRFFYDESHLERHSALPHPVVAALFGKGAVHTLDREAHRHRKALFIALLMDGGVDALAKLTGESFDEAAESWRLRPSVTLFDESALVIARAVTRWAGIPVSEEELPALAADLVAMVDGFATLGPRHWRALAARRRRERWLAGLIEGVRRGDVAAPADSALTTIAHYREDGGPLKPRTAAVEMLNIIRPATAVAWFVAFSAHALDRWPQHRRPLRAGDDEFTAGFVHEVRRFYPFAPFLGGRAVADLTFSGEQIPKGALVLLDLYGQNHDHLLFPKPYEFRPERFTDRPIGEFDLIPQGGGDPRTGHRCPGEQITVALLGTLVQRLARLDYYLAPQDLSIDLSRIPARPRSGVEISVP
jgi:fatty-acid peroxygenase